MVENVGINSFGERKVILPEEVICSSEYLYESAATDNYRTFKYYSDLLGGVIMEGIDTEEGWIVKGTAELGDLNEYTVSIDARINAECIYIEFRTVDATICGYLYGWWDNPYEERREIKVGEKIETLLYLLKFPPEAGSFGHILTPLYSDEHLVFYPVYWSEK